MVENIPFHELYKMEKELGLFSLQYKGVNYWQLVRFPLFLQLSYAGYRVSCQTSERSYSKEIAGSIWQAMRMWFAWKKLHPADVVRLRHNFETVRNGESDDHQYDYFCFGEDISVKDIYIPARYQTIPNPSAVTMAGAEAKIVLWKIKRKLLGADDIDARQKHTLRLFLAKLTEIYGVPLSLDKLIGDIQYAVACHICYRSSFEKLFGKLDPKVILLYPHYDDQMFAAIAAARKLGIYSVELQHGEVVDHGAFLYEDQSENGKILPDYFLTYGQWWNEQMQLPECMQVVTVGNPYLDYQVKKYPYKDGSKKITVFSNTISGHDMVDLIASCYDEIISRGYQVVFKLHPREVANWREEYPFLEQNPDIEVVESGSVYELIADSAIILGVRTTVFYEALVYENVVIALDPKGDMRYLLNNRLAYPVSGKEDLVKLLKNECSAGESKQVASTYLWMPNGGPNTVAFIRKLIGK